MRARRSTSSRSTRASLSFDRDLNVVNDIAETYDVSPDQTVYTFHLRRNVLFHDQSRRVTAGDFKFSIERALNPDTLSTVARGVPR